MCIKTRLLRENESPEVHVSHIFSLVLRLWSRVALVLHGGVRLGSRAVRVLHRVIRLWSRLACVFHGLLGVGLVDCTHVLKLSKHVEDVCMQAFSLRMYAHNTKIMI